jgi:hypothetical protein
MAQDLYTTAEFTFISEYMSQGSELSDGPVFQVYSEIGFGGLYFGAFATTTDQALSGADRSVDLLYWVRGAGGAHLL